MRNILWEWVGGEKKIFAIYWCFDDVQILQVAAATIHWSLDSRDYAKQSNNKLQLQQI